jgi:uncharacterized protein
VRSTSPDLRRIFRPIFALIIFAAVFGIVSCDKAKTPHSVPEITTQKQRSPGTHSPRLAIILDDVGSDPSAIDAIYALSYPLTLSVLPHHPQSTSMAEEAHLRGYELMLHLPMESQSNEAPELQQIHAGMSKTEMAQLLGEMLQNVPHVAGVNNHQGSLVTSDTKLMEELMPLLRERKLFFIDSRTTAATVAYETAQRDGVRSGFRNVPFLDDVEEESAIRRQLELAIRGAKEKGEAIVIGHPHPETLRVLREVLPQVQAQGVELVHASALVH